MEMATDTPGSVVVSDGGMLTADHINQTSLMIGNGSTFTIAPSNADGTAMASVGSGNSLLLAGSLTPSSSFVAASGNLLSAGSSSAAALSPSLGGVGGSVVSAVSAVPEPSTMVLLALAGLIGLGARMFRRR